ncbi:hypothetical protein ACP70R_030822 [Stipagrostis hirtigluma subsp. patula]
MELLSVPELVHRAFAVTHHHLAAFDLAIADRATIDLLHRVFGVKHLHFAASNLADVELLYRASVVKHNTLPSSSSATTPGSPSSSLRHAPGPVLVLQPATSINTFNSPSPLRLRL